MVKAYIELKNFDELQKFHETALTCRYNLAIETDTKRINAKSLIGLMCISSKGTVTLAAQCNNKAEIMSMFGEFIAN